MGVRWQWLEVTSRAVELVRLCIQLRYTPARLHSWPAPHYTDTYININPHPVFNIELISLFEMSSTSPSGSYLVL